MVPSKGYSFGYEIWKDGKIYAPVDYACMDGMRIPFSGKLTLSLKDISEYTGKPQMKLIFGIEETYPGHHGWGGSSTLITKPELEDEHMGIKEIWAPIIASEEESVGVWGYMRGKGSNLYDGGESVTEMAARVDWALVIKVKVGNTRKDKKEGDASK